MGFLRVALPCLKPGWQYRPRHPSPQFWEAKPGGESAPGPRGLEEAGPAASCSGAPQSSTYYTPLFQLEVSGRTALF